MPSKTLPEEHLKYQKPAAKGNLVVDAGGTTSTPELLP